MSCDVGKATKGLRMSCDVGEVTEGLENEQTMKIPRLFLQTLPSTISTDVGREVSLLPSV